MKLYSLVPGGVVCCDVAPVEPEDPAVVTPVEGDVVPLMPVDARCS